MGMFPTMGMLIESMNAFSARRLEDEFMKAVKLIQGADSIRVLKVLTTLRKTVSTLGTEIVVDLQGVKHEEDKDVNLLEAIDGLIEAVHDGDSATEIAYLLNMYALYLKAQYKPEIAYSELAMKYDIDFENLYNNL